MNENEIAIYKNASKEVLRGKRIAINACNREGERSQVNTVCFYLKKLEKKQNEPKASWRTDIIKIRPKSRPNEKLILQKNQQNW